MLLIVADRKVYEDNNLEIREEINNFIEEVHKRDKDIQFKHLYESAKTLSSLKEYEAVVLYSYRDASEILKDIEGKVDAYVFYIDVNEKSNKKYYKAMTKLLDYYFEEEDK